MTTAGHAKMNLVLHNKSTAKIANTKMLLNLKLKNGDSIERVDFAIENHRFHILG